MSGDIVKINRVLPGLLDRVSDQKPAAPPAKTEGPGFAEELGKLLDATNDAQMEAGKIQEAFLNGEPVELHQVMIKGEQAGLTMDLLLEVRNKLVTAYKDLVTMPM
jgi:flagellar hook-basal body complex protein FliE